MTVIANGNLTIDENKILQTRLAVLRLVRTSTGVLRLIWAYLGYGYRRTSTTATGVLQQRLRGYARVYYVNFFYCVYRRDVTSYISHFHAKNVLTRTKWSFTPLTQNSDFKV